MKRIKTSISINKELKELAEKYAHEQNRTLSNYIEHALRLDLKRKGKKLPLS